MRGSAFDVYSTSSGLKQISNSVRQKILNELQEQDLSLSEIADLTNKAQSTLSVHLDKMVKMGLVSSRDDPSDNRRKIFYLISDPVGSSVVPRDDLKEAIGNTINDSIGDSCTFMKGILRSVILGIEAIGFNMDPVLKDIGKQIGKELSKHMESDSLEGVIENIQEFYDKHGLGEVCVYSFLPLTLIIRDNGNCSDIPEATKTLYLINEGVLETILENNSEMSLKVTDSECFGTELNCCKYIIEPAAQ